MHTILFIVLLMSSALLADHGKDYGACYEKLEVIHFRWTIRNYTSIKTIYSGLGSPSFPIEPSAESKFYLAHYHDDDDYKYFYVCIDTSSRKRELVGFSLNVLEKDFSRFGHYYPGTLWDPVYIPKLSNNAICPDYTGLNAYGLQSYVVNTDLDLLLILERVRKLPNCLAAGEEDLGRGKITTLPKPPAPKAYHCTTSTTLLREIKYTYMVDLPTKKEEGFDVTSPIFPSTTDEYQWQVSLKKDKDSEDFGVSLTLVSEKTVSAGLTIGFPPDYLGVLQVHEYSPKSKTYGVTHFKNFEVARKKYFSSGSKWTVFVTITISDIKETCEAVCPLWDFYTHDKYCWDFAGAMSRPLPKSEAVKVEQSEVKDDSKSIGGVMMETQNVAKELLTALKDDKEDVKKMAMKIQENVKALEDLVVKLECLNAANGTKTRK